MAFASTSIPTHARYLAPNLSLLLEPRFLNYSHMKAPAPRLSLNVPAPYVDLPNDWFMEPYPDATLQFSTLNSRKLLSPSFIQTQPFPYTPIHTGLGKEREKGSVFGFKNWQASSEWLKHMESVQQLHTFKASTIERSKDLFSVPDWSNAIKSQDPSTLIKEDICPFSHHKGNTDLETANDDTRTSGSKNCMSKANDSQVIRHSIREILKPRENSPLPHDVRIRKRRTQTLNNEATKSTSPQSHHSSWMKSKCFKSDGNRSDKNLKDVRFKLRQKVSSILTEPSSSHAEICDVVSSKSSKKSKARSTSESLGDISTFSPLVVSAQNFLDSRPMSPHASTTRIQSERKTFQCPQCRYVTDRKNNLKRHIVTMHQDSGKILECCGIPFQSKAALRDHNTVFHRGGYRCQICARNFCRKALLRRHLTVHSGQKDFFCELCGYATSHKSNLERHQKVHIKKLDDLRSLGSKQVFPTKSNLDLSQSESRSRQVTSSFLDLAHVTVNSDDDFINSTINGHDYLSNPDHLNDVTESPFNQEFYYPIRYKGKRAGFLTSRLEETYDRNTDHIPSFIPSTRLEPNDMNISSVIEMSDNDTSPTNSRLQNDSTNYHRQSFTQEIKSPETKTKENDRGIFGEKNESTYINLEAQTIGNSLPVTIKENFHEPSNSSSPIFGAEEEPKTDLALPYESHDVETSGAEKDVSKKRQKVQSKCRICPVFYQCDECGQKLPSQHEVHSHSCSKVSADRILGLSLVTALQKGCLKPQN